MNDVVILEVSGRVDGSNAEQFDRAMGNEVSDSDKGVVLDLASLVYISSAGLRSILMLAKNLQNRPTDLVMCEMQGPIKEIFSIAGFDRIIKVVGTRSDALASVAQG